MTMKKILRALAASIIVLGASSCFGDNESYFTPAAFYVPILIQNQDEANLLDTTTVHNWADSTIILTYKDKTYTSEDAPEMTTTDMKLGKYDMYNTYSTKTVRVLAFGMFEGIDDIDNDLVLTWPDNSSDIIHVKNKGTWAKSGKGFTSLERWIKLNGEDVLSELVVVTKTVRGEEPDGPAAAEE